MFNDLVGVSGSELRLQTVRERELDQQLKQSVEREQKVKDELTQLKDDISRLQQQLRSSRDRETRLQQQLKLGRSEVFKQSEGSRKKSEHDTKRNREERLSSDLKLSSDKKGEESTKSENLDDSRSTSVSRRVSNYNMYNFLFLLPKNRFITISSATCSGLLLSSASLFMASSVLLEMSLRIRRLLPLVALPNTVPLCYIK